jgi:radical SAM protein with 4Fe4S-binding SPASM domain
MPVPEQYPLVRKGFLAAGDAIALGKEPDLPMALQIELTSHCNLKCRMCPLTTGGTASSAWLGHMQEVTWRQVVPMARRVGKVMFVGYGEALLSRDCIPLMNELDRLGVQMSISTNGTPLTRSIVGQLAAISGLHHINVSIDSQDPAAYRKIRGGDVVRALDGLSNLMSGIGDPNRVTVSSVVMPENFATLPDFPRLLARLGVRRYLVQGLVDYVPGIGAGSLADEQVSAVERIFAACKASGVEAEYSRVYPDAAPAAGALNPDASDTRMCTVAWELPFIDKDGRVYPCCRCAAHSTDVMGHLKRESLDAVWEGDAYRRFRADILDGATMRKVCRECNSAPLGCHPLKAYAASLMLGESSLRGTRNLRLVVRNVGARAWTATDQISIGTARPHDHHSPFADAGWRSPNRVATFDESVVPIGATATFRFSLRSGVGEYARVFQLVADGHCWIPDTTFSAGPCA